MFNRREDCTPSKWRDGQINYTTSFGGAPAFSFMEKILQHWFEKVILQITSMWLWTHCLRGKAPVFWTYVFFLQHGWPNMPLRIGHIDLVRTRRVFVLRRTAGSRVLQEVWRVEGARSGPCKGRTLEEESLDEARLKSKVLHVVIKSREVQNCYKACGHG